MASKEKIKKKKTKAPSPAVTKKSKAPSQTPETEVADENLMPEDVQSSQVSVRSADQSNIKDNTVHDPNFTDDGIPVPQQSDSGPQTSISETKKTKSDLVEQKLGKDKKKKDGKKRAPSPVEMPMTGSAVSLRSNISRASKEAWVERKQEDVIVGGTKVVSFQDQPATQTNKGTTGPLNGPVVSSQDQPATQTNKGTTGPVKGPSRIKRDNKVAPSDSDGQPLASSSTKSSSLVSVKDAAVKREAGLKGIKVEVEEDCPEKHAYIPYLYARNCIAKIMEDMSAMKQSHIIIVENIQEHYGTIESETQEQFNMFVLCMREEYSSKRQAFRQVIDLHKVELDKKEQYWNEMLASLAERNNRLLKEKKMLLVHNKTEIERLEKERDEMSKNQYSTTSGSPTPVPAPMPGAWEDERKVLQDQLANEKSTNASLRQQMANQNPESRAMESGQPIKNEVSTVDEKQTAAFGAGALATASVMELTKDNNKQMETERREITEERSKLAEERSSFEAEREGFTEERGKWMDKILELETELATHQVSGNEWKTKHDIVQGRLNEAGDIQAKYLTLESQYAALALLVKDCDTSAAVKGELEKTQSEMSMMTEEKNKLDNDITKWEKDFEKSNNRKPTDDDKSDSVREMYTTLEEVSYMVTTLETKESTLKQVESGKVPDVPDIPHKPIDTKEPEVVTVQVKVPDPSIVQELKQSQSQVTIVKTEVTTLQQEISELRSEISTQHEQIAKQRGMIAELEHEVAKVKAEGLAAGAGILATAGGSSVSDEELEALKKENRELRRDMKKMIKQYERLQAMKQGMGEGVPEGTSEEMAETMGHLDNKIADLEAENEALKEEKLILKEKVKTITETITVTHFEDNKRNMEEKDQKIDELLNELTKLREENVSMAKDMKKMVKSHVKTKARLDELVSAEKAVKLLEIVAMLIHEIHSTVPDAASQVNDKLTESTQEVGQSKQVLDGKQAAYQQWLDKYQKAHGKTAAKADRDSEGTDLHDDWEDAKSEFKNKHLYMSALQLMKTGDVHSAVGKDESTEDSASIELANLERALGVADDKLIELEATYKNIESDRDRYRDKVENLEKLLVDMQKQVELNQTLMADSQSTAELTEQLSDLQKKSDGFEAELMQERMSHMSTRDELETLRKQMDTVKEEMENEKQGVEVRIAAVKTGLESQMGVKDEELNAMRSKNEQLEAERLSKLPPDTAAEIKTLQDKLRQLEQDQSGSKTSSAALTAQVAELNSKLDVTSKNLETTRAANRELEAKVKSGRLEKDKETKKVSRHMEEKQHKAANEDKQRIQLLVKRVKELESHAGKSKHLKTVVPVGVASGDKANAEVLKLKREIKDKDTEIKRMEKEVRFGGGAAGAAAVKEEIAEKNKTAKQEKVLKEMEKRMSYEKEKGDKLTEGLKAADLENKNLKKELDEKAHNLAKLGAEMKTISMAAKEGIEAAEKVKSLEKDTKRLGDENVVLTKNFESERVLRKKYYNMVEDMKGKIRVYCRARPMSKSELDRGNKAVCRSSDEYSISVDGTRGLKEFQYDQVFMENSTQEKIFEDTNNLIQSAVDGYNVCIFAYGQTGSGKTFTMIGDKEQNYPGIAPRAFTRVYDLANDIKDKFTMKVEVYMMELYNERLIDLFAKPGSHDDEKLEIKKDKKGMVFVQGSIIKVARNSKELFALFEEGSTNRHVASTKMNAESSRSHLVVGIILECTNKNTGNVTRGKLSLVDLAGSERVAKTQAGADQLKEAMSINKSLSALGDVISALSSEQQFIPYRNNKLTMLMQDSLGGNAKTLMFVNISPADYNMDETVISLTYASRVKLITNDASKNADNKEIARLRAVIDKLKKGETVGDEEL